MDYFLKWNSTWKPPMSNQEPWCSLEHREDSAPGLPERGYARLSSFALIPIHRLLDDPFSTSLQLVSPISSWSLCEYVDLQVFMQRIPDSSVPFGLRCSEVFLSNYPG